MKHGRFIFVAALLLSFSANAANYIVKYKPSATMSTFSTIEGLNILDSHSTGELVKVEINDSADEIEVLGRLHQNPDIDYVVKDFKLHAFNAPVSAQQLREQWAIEKVRANEAWSKAGNKGKTDIVIAVIDTGVDYNHESLKPNMVPGYDFKDSDNNPMDDTGRQNPGHGTHCAGIIGATGLVDGGIVGIAPGIKMMPLRFLGADGSGDLMAGIRAIDYAIENGAKVISASWGATVQRSQAQPLIEAVQRANDAGVIFVAAAANDGRNNDQTDVFPANANFPNTITVAASGPQDEKPNWSNYGTATVHLAAPGLNIMSTLPNNRYDNLSGTSMATPLVSGLVGLLLSQDASLSGADARAILQLTGAQVQIQTACNCRVDAADAVETVVDQKMHIVPAAATLAINDTLDFRARNANGSVSYASSDDAIATIDANGKLTAVAEGTVKVTVTDAAGNSSESLNINVGQTSGGGNPGGDCPLGDPLTCQFICVFNPSLPWCQQSGLPF